MGTALASFFTCTAYIGTICGTGHPGTPMVDAIALFLMLLAGAMALMLMIETSRKNTRLNKMGKYLREARHSGRNGF